MDGPQCPAFAEAGPIDVPLFRFVDGEGRVDFQSGTANPAIQRGSATPAGRLLLVVQDLDACESAECMSEEGGERPALWVRTPK